MNTQFGLRLLAAGILLSGCANMSETQNQTAMGTGVGAAAGAAIGALAGGGKGAAIGAGVGALAGAGGGYYWSQRMQTQKQTLETATQGTSVAVSQTPNNELKLEIPSDISFESGKANIQPSLRPILDKLAQTLQANSATHAHIIGHTDNVGSDAVNDPLSMRRADAVRQYLVGQGVAVERIEVDGRGAREPVSENSTPAGRAKNRRVEILLMEAPASSGPGETVPPPSPSFE